MCTHLHAVVRACICAHIHCLHAYAHTYIAPQAYAHTHIYTHARTQARTHARAVLRLLRLLRVLKLLKQLRQLQIIVSGLLEGLKLTVNVYNLLDEEYWGVISPDENVGYFNYGNERTLYLTAEAQF